MEATNAKRRGELLWEPSTQAVERSQMTAYMRWLATERGIQLDAYEALWRWSVTELEDFWASIWDYFEVLSSTPYSQVLPERVMPGASWFAGTELNYAEHVFRDKPGDRTAVLHASELRELDELSWDELRERVARVAAGLRSLGVVRGDRVVAYLPNVPEALIAFLATASIGAIWSSCSPDFGSGSVIDRFAQIEPKVLFAIDGYRYNGKDFDRTETVAGLQREMPTIERTIVVPYLDPDPDHGRLGKPMGWDELLAAGDGAPLEFDRVPFDYPLWVLYSSGTTGLPKAIVQGHGGILLEHLKKLNLHVDLHEDDRLFWFTTTGWMMWNFLVSGLLGPAAIVLYDGSPGYPDMDVLWDLAERTRMTCFGTSASYVAACMKAEIEPGAGHDLSALRAVGSTGSPLSPEGFDWIYRHVGEDTWLFSTSGGTDVCTAFVGGVPLLGVYRGELQARSLGCNVQAWDEAGHPLVGAVGELVITEPMPSMPLFFWGDESGERSAALRQLYEVVERRRVGERVTARGILGRRPGEDLLDRHLEHLAAQGAWDLRDLEDVVGHMSGAALLADPPFDLGAQFVVQLDVLAQDDEQRHPALGPGARHVNDEGIEDLGHALDGAVDLARSHADSLAVDRRVRAPVDHRGAA